MNTNFELPRNIPNLPRNIVRIFVQQLAVLEQFHVFIFKNRVDDTKTQHLTSFLDSNLAVIKLRSLLSAFSGL
jgi:hypothetical protein